MQEKRTRADGDHIVVTARNWAVIDDFAGAVGHQPRECEPHRLADFAWQERRNATTGRQGGGARFQVLAAGVPPRLRASYGLWIQKDSWPQSFRHVRCGSERRLSEYRSPVLRR